MLTHSFYALAFLAMAAAVNDLASVTTGGIRPRQREALMLASLGGALAQTSLIAFAPLTWLTPGLDGVSAFCLLAAVGAFWPAVARLKRGQMHMLAARALARAQRAEAEAEALRAWLGMAEQAGHVGHFQLSVPDHVLIWSDEMYRIHGLWREHYRPRLELALEALHPMDGRRIGVLLRALMEQAGEVEAVARLRRPDGELRHVLIRAQARRGEQGDVTALFGVMVDVTASRGALTLPQGQSQAGMTEDELTGLPDHAQFDSGLGHEFKRAVRARKPLGLVLLEIDQFQHYATRYGARAAERAFSEVARVVRLVPRRSGDLVARYSETEIAVLLPLADQNGAARVAMQIMEAVRGLGLPDDGRETGQLTISCGTAAFIGLDDLYNPAELTRKAARALADARLFGGDRICAYREPALQGEKA